MKMSAVERERLIKQYEQFTAMSSERRDALRRLHAEIERDAQSNGNLQTVLVNYQSWLATLTPWQRAEVRNEPDPEKRLALVVRFKQEQAEPEESPVPAPPDHAHPRPARHVDIRLAHLSRDDYNKALGIIEESLNLPPEKRAQLESYSRARRHVNVILAAVGDAQDGPDRSRSRRWLDDNAVNRIVEGIADEHMRTRLSNDELSPDMRRNFLGMMIHKGLEQEVGNELNRRMPKEKELMDFFRTLQQDKENELLKQPTGRERYRLVMRYFQKNKDPLALDYIELQKRLAPFLNRRRPFDKGPPQFRGDGASGPRERGQRRDSDARPPEKDRRPDGDKQPPDKPAAK